MLCPPRPEGHRRIARLLSALADGAVASTADREDVAAIEERWPGTGAQIRAARAFHARAAAGAVTTLGARGILAWPVGYPCDPDPHRPALAADPGVRVVIAAADEEVALVGRAVWGSDERVTVIGEAVPDATALIRRPEARRLMRPDPGRRRVPVCVLLPWVASLLDPGEAAGMLAEFGALLPARSVVVLSWWAAGRGADELVGAWRERIGPGWAHSAGSVGGWMAAAGMEVLREPRDVRVPRDRQWAERLCARRPGGRALAAVGRVR
jgi:hypothetical protein